MNSRTNAVFGLVLVLTCGASTRGGDAWIGYRGPNGTGVFADSKPPVDCDMKTGRNIVWKSPMPHWGHGCPVVAGGRVFALSEPGWKHDWPVLTCMDAATGKILWENEVEHLSVTGLDEAKRKEVATAWRDFHAKWRDLYRTFNLSVVQKKVDEATAKFDALGYEFGGHKGGGYGQLRSCRTKNPAQTNATLRLLATAGLRPETWHHGCGLGTDCIGMTFASPVSDGTNVWVTTMFSGAACYDMDGNVKWKKYVPCETKTEAYARSPLLYRDLLVSDYYGKVVAFDKATGEMRWTVQTKAGSIATPTVITVGGADLLLTEGSQEGGSGVHAVRLLDGKQMKIHGWSIGGTQMIVDTDRRDVAYFCGHGQHSFWPETGDPIRPPAAVRFALDGETLKATVLWDGRNFVGAGGFVGMLYHGGKLYCSTDGSAVVIDAASGKLVAGSMEKKGRGAPRPLPPTRHLLLLAGDKFYGLDGSHRTCDGNFQTVATLTCYSIDGKELGRSVLSAAAVEGEKLDQIRSAVGWDKWPFAYGFPFTISGDRIYVRSFDEMICIGQK